MSKIQVRPGKGGAWVGIITGLFFLIFGVVFLTLVMEEGGESRTIAGIFLVFWVLVMLVIIGVNVLNLVKRNPPAMLVMETEDTPGQTTSGQTLDFSVRLRTLEKLKTDGLISEQEYRAKRSEIMKDKW